MSGAVAATWFRVASASLGFPRRSNSSARAICASGEDDDIGCGNAFLTAASPITKNSDSRIQSKMRGRSQGPFLAWSLAVPNRYCTNYLKVDSQTELHLSHKRVVRQAGNRGTIRAVDAATGIAQVGMIKHVIGLGPELNIDALAYGYDFDN